MVQLAYSLRFAPPTSSHYRPTQTPTQILQGHCNHISTRYGCQAVLTPIDTVTLKRPSQQCDYNLTITGPAAQVVAARGDLIRDNPLLVMASINTSRSDLYTDTGVIKDAIHPLLDKISKETNVSVNVEITGQMPASGLQSENGARINIQGSPESVEYARIQALVLLDELAGLRTDTIDIPARLHNLVCGRKRCYLQSIMEETSTNIYLPSAFTNVNHPEMSVQDDLHHHQSARIYVTGTPSSITRAKDMLNKLYVQKTKSMYQKDSILHPRKGDWLLMHRRDDLLAIMEDNASFIIFSTPGSGNNMITVFAESRVNAERTLRALNHLACNVYEATFFFYARNGPMYSAEGANFFNSMSNLSTLVLQLSQISGAEVAYKTETGSIEVIGSERAIRNVYQHINGMNLLKVYHHDTIFLVELSNEQREFISGKKSGKINKIMKTSGVKIKFLPFSEYNFVIEVQSTSFVKALDGLTLLQEELPAEISFYVPEAYHKRIIGVGGKNIQRIMKKYGVYVKFSNAEEFAALGGYYDNDDNVVARTPMKNQINLDNLRHAVMELISSKDKDYTTKEITIPHQYHRIMVMNHAQEIHDIEQRTNTRIRWPKRELSSDAVVLHGPESQLSIASQLLSELIPEEYYLRVPYSTALGVVTGSDDFKEKVVNRIRQEFNIHLQLPDTAGNEHLELEPSTSTGNKRSSSRTSLSRSDATPISSPETPTSSSACVQSDLETNGQDYVFTFQFNCSALDALPNAVSVLKKYLHAYQITTYPESTTERPKSDSFAGTFSPFDNKLFGAQMQSTTSTTTSSSQPDVTVPSSAFSTYSLFDYSSSNAFDTHWKPIRESTSSSPDNLRAIFDKMSVSDHPVTGLMPQQNHSTPVRNTNLSFGRTLPMPSSSQVADIWTQGPIGGGSNNPPAPPTMHTSFSGPMDTTLPLLGNYPPPGTFDLSSPRNLYPLQNQYGGGPTTDDNEPMLHHHALQPTASSSTDTTSSMASSRSMPEAMLDRDAKPLPQTSNSAGIVVRPPTSSSSTPMRSKSWFVAPQNGTPPPPLMRASSSGSSSFSSAPSNPALFSYLGGGPVNHDTHRPSPDTNQRSSWNTHTGSPAPNGWSNAHDGTESKSDWSFVPT
ncbi:hypothetical protein BC943DRAFT_381309 [Umbelopsis sp. AD052]|nr:hypothetical protein BC943DRAFT_381309 [Umbelopsis sp. AD052]